MSNELATAIGSIEERFEKQNTQALTWEKEARFALQQITRSSYIKEAAEKNQESLKNAIINVAAIGISLNPAAAQAYLVPRDNMVCLDISYRGLVKLATDSGSILWAKSELVYKGDEFVYNGPSTLPQHNADVFADGREPTPETIKGVYTLAKTPDGDYLVDIMTIKEIEKVRMASKAKNGPWFQYFGEMCKKTALKRASKQWPATDKSRLDQAISVVNEHEGMMPESITAGEVMGHSPDQKTYFDSLLKAGDAMHVYCFLKSVGPNVSTSLYNSFEKGSVTKFKRLIDELSSEGQRKFNLCLDELTMHINNDDSLATEQCLEQCSTPEKSLLIDHLDGDQLQFIAEIEAAA